MGDAGAVRTPARLARRVLAAAVAGGCVFCALGPSTPRVSVAAAPAPAVVVPAALTRPGWTPASPIERQRAASVLRTREATAPALPVGRMLAATPAAAPATAAPAPSRYATDVAASAAAVEVALRFALAQLGKPYVWGAEGPDAYDCSGLTQASYAAAGIALPRTSREQALVGTPVALADLRAGDLVFWAYDPGDLRTVHHVALYAGDGLVVQAPQPGETVEVARLWLDGYAGAVRVATGTVTGLSVVPGSGLPLGLPGGGVPGGGLPGGGLPTAGPGPGPSGAPSASPSPGPGIGTSAPAPSPTGSPTGSPSGSPSPTTPGPSVSTGAPGTVPPSPDPTSPAPAPTTAAPTTDPPPPPPTTPPPPGPTATSPAVTSPAVTSPAASTSAAAPTATATAGP